MFKNQRKRIVYAAQNSLMQPQDWLFSFLYMAAGLMFAQQIVIRSSGMKYTDFLKNVRSTAGQNKAA